MENEFGALFTIAARVSVADKRINPVARHKEWYIDPAVVAIQDADENYLPVHHLVKADSWLPTDFKMILETEVPERDMIFGSLTQLSSALKTMDHILTTPNKTTRKLPAQFVNEPRMGQKTMQKLWIGRRFMGCRF